MTRLVIIACLAIFISSCAWFTSSKKTEDKVDVVEVPEPEIAPEVRTKAENFVSDGVTYYQNGNYEESIDAWKNAIELIPGDAEIHNFLGISYHKMDAFDKAKTEFKIATELDSTYYEAYNNLGYMLFLQENYDDAAKAFEKSLAINPDYDPARLNYKKTEKIMNGELLREVFELTEQAEQLDDVDKKVEYYIKILDIDPEYAEGHNNIGVAYYYADNLDSAYYHLNEAIRLKKDYPEAINNLGYVYKVAGRNQDAVALFLKAISLKQRYGIALNNLGETYVALGELENARRVFQTAVDVEPENQYAMDNLKLIDEKLDSKFQE